MNRYGWQFVLHSLFTMSLLAIAIGFAQLNLWPEAVLSAGATGFPMAGAMTAWRRWLDTYGR